MISFNKISILSLSAIYLFLPLALARELSSSVETKQQSPNETFLFYGNSMVERLLENGELEARLQLAAPNHNLRIRSLAWTGDEVGHRLRLEGYAKHLKKLLEKWPSNHIILGYGLNESFGGLEELADFETQYKEHLKQLKKSHPNARFALLSPIAIEDASVERQKEVESYSQAIANIAAEDNRASFLDLFTATKEAYSKSSSPLTSNGIHLNTKGNQLVAKLIAQFLVGYTASNLDSNHLKEVALAASFKHHRVAEIVRPKNAVVYFGVRARPKEYKEEIPRYHEMIRLTEETVHRLASDSSLKFSDLATPSLPPLPERKGKSDGDKTGIIKSPAEAMAEFTVAEGFEVNLFASEEEFPELRNPVQIAFDARGRLWVVTMPSFPHTVPGLTPPDKIIILEDTDGDGKADKLTPFMEGLDALDGVAFHPEGVVISEQPRLWLVKDTDGDDRADSKTELLRGIDVTDSHHGGMIAADPYGDILFSDGVFHRSQLETPFGVHRGIDATTYRLNTTTEKIVTEWQHTTPNPWKISHTRWGETLQMYGDGHVYDGPILTWGPLGAHHSFRHGKIASYGKGSGLSVVSSSNFPDEWQQSTVSAALLGRYAVTLTKFEASQGMLKATKDLTIIESPNAAFRPADLEFGSDGALYVSDFCSPIIGHAQHAMRDPYWDHDFGRIWRVVHSDKPATKSSWPKIEGISPNELCQLLVHPIDLVRHHTRIELRKHGKDGLAAVDKWSNMLDPQDPNYDLANLEATFIATSFGEARPQLLKNLLKSKSERFRGAALKAIRLQADQLDNPIELLSLAKNDSHPRVQIELVDAIAHLRPQHPEVESIIEGFKPLTKEAEAAYTFLEKGTDPLKGRSVPVLDIAPEARLLFWEFLEETEEELRFLNTSGKNVPFVGKFRTYVHSPTTQSAIIGLKHLNLDVFFNQSLVFSQDSLWSGDQQISVELKEGLNVIEVVMRESRRTKEMPPIFLYNSIGQSLTKTTYPNEKQFIKNSSKDFEQLLSSQGTVLRVKSALGLQFAPTELRANAGEEVTLVFENPDNMQHNWVLLAPGSLDEIGSLADKLASSPEGAKKQYLPDSPHILAATDLLAPNASQELTFTAPEESGEYPYLCTFPGHWRIMKGVLIIE